MVTREGDKKIVRAPIDIVVINMKNNLTYPIELKYKTKKCEINHKNEIYSLTEHGATNIGRFSFRKDIYRLEQLMKEKIEQGFFIVITNENKYLQNVLNKDILDRKFSFHDGMILQKEDNGWNYEKQISNGYIQNDKFELMKNNKFHWTYQGDEFYKLDLKNTYKIKWEVYSQLNKINFYISVVEIKNS